MAMRSVLAILILFVSLLDISISTESDNRFTVASDLEKPSRMRHEKLSHFRVYWHDVLSGENPTSVLIVPPPDQKSGFGQVRMFDNRLTTGPELNSTLVGRAQGYYALASQDSKDLCLFMAMNFEFVEGKYNGSTITVQGRNAVFNKVREMPVIGGSGLFRFARGYVQAKTQWFDLKSGDACVAYDVYVLHY